MGAEIAAIETGWLAEVGDVVYLKSGGPAMTVSQEMRIPETEDTSLVVHWYDEEGKLQGALFPPECLTMTKPDAVQCPSAL